MGDQKKWYQANSGIIALLFLFFPAGLYLMWKYSPWPKKTRWFVTGVVVVLLLISSIFNLAGLEPTEVNESSSEEKKQVQGQEVNKETESSSYKEERKQALQLVWDYKLQQDLNYPPIDKTTTLLRAFQIAEQEKVLVFDPGWFAVKEGDRVVVGWLGTRAGSVHYPEWEVKNNKITVLNGSAKTYTPELEEQFSESVNASERDKNLYDRFNEIIDKEIMPEFDKKVEEAGTSDTKIAEANEWYDEQEVLVMQRVAKEFEITAKEAKEIYLDVSFAEADSGEKIAESRGKILSKDEILKLLEEQGSLE